MSTTAAWCEKAAQALQRSSIPLLRHIRVNEKEDSLVMSGRVPSYYFKQLAQETVLPVLDGRRLINQVTVAEDGEWRRSTPELVDASW